MRIDRRSMLKAGAGASALAGLGATTAAAALAAPALIFYDSRIAESAEFARDMLGQARLFDIADADERRWSLLRDDLPQASAIEGLTGWNDWVLIRSELDKQGWRFVRDDKVSAPLSGKAHLMRWSLKLRS